METEVSIIDWLLNSVGPTAIFYLLLGFGVMVFTDVIKGASKGVGGKLSKLGWIKITGAGSLIVASVASVFVANKFGLNVFDLCESLKATDPELAMWISSGMALGVARWLHAIGINLPAGILKS